MQELYNDKLSSLDEIMFRALQEAFYERIDKEKPIIGETDDDIKIGQRTRAYEKAKEIIDKTFIDIKSLKTGRPPDKVFAKQR